MRLVVTDVPSIHGNTSKQKQVVKLRRIDKDGFCPYRFGELAARLHDAKAQGNDLCGQKEVDHFLLIRFHQSTCAQRGHNIHFLRHHKYTGIHFYYN